MPNWCFNDVEFIGSKKDIESLKELLGGEDTESKKIFDFNKIIPMPEELRRVGNPVSIVSEEEYQKVSEKENSIPITQTISNEYKKKYGFDNWYDWACGTWGTKWEACEAECINESETSLQYNFSTAWCPPRGIFLALKKMCPKVAISWGYEERGCSLYGTWHYNGGQRKIKSK